MQTITLDIGGTTIKSAIIDDFNMFHKNKLPTNANLGYDKVMESIFNSIDYLIPKLKEGDYKIGISSAGDINPIDGVVTYATSSLPNFSGLKLKEIIETKYNIETHIVNDALSATIAEYELNEELKGKDFVMLTLGTGVGGGVMINNKILLGENYKACRLGHVKLFKNGRTCPCGESGCIESYISAKGFLKTASEFGISYDEANLVFNNADRETLNKIIEKFTDDLIDTVDIFANIFDPYAIVLGGGLVMTGNFWFNRLLEKNKKSVKILKAKLKNDAGVLGAYCVSNNINKYY